MPRLDNELLIISSELDPRDMTSPDHIHEVDLSHFSQVPWCTTLLSDPHFKITRTSSPTPKPSTEDSFFGSTLATSSTIRACVTQLRSPSHTAAGLEIPYPAISEVRTLFSLGSGVNSHPHVAHGGFAATLLDEVMGDLLSVNKDYEEQRLRSQNKIQSHQLRPGATTMTVSLSLSYRKPIPTPGMLLVRAWFDCVNGKKHFVCGAIENGTGDVLTQGRALFVRVREKL